MKKKQLGQIVGILVVTMGLCTILVLFQAYMEILGVVAVAVLALLLVLGIRFYDFALILMPFMFYLNIGGAVNTSLADFIILIWGMQVLCNRFRRRSADCLALRYTQKYMIKYSVIFMSIMMLSMVNLIRWYDALLFQAILSIFKIFICFIYVLFTIDYIHRFGRERFLCIMAYNTLFFCMLMIVGVIAYTLGVDLGLTFSGTFRATGTFEDPNLAAAYLFIMMSFSFSYFTEKKKYILLAATVILVLSAVFLTSSKGALVAIVVGGTFVIVVNLLRGNIGVVFKLLCSYILVAIALLYLYRKVPFIQQVAEPVFNRLEEFTGNIQGDHSLAHREFLWKTAFDLGMTSPILGIGVEQFRPAASQYTGTNVWNIVHNTYLTFFCELGIVGFVAFFRLWIKNLWNHFMLLKKCKNSIFYLLSMLCVSVSMWSISLGNFRSLWVFMTFALYEYNRIRTER